MLALKNATTPCSKVLVEMLKTVLTTLREKDHLHICRTGVRRCFIVDSYDQAAISLRTPIRKRRSNRPLNRLRTLDFKRMYDTLPHTDLIDRTTTVVREAAAHFYEDVDQVGFVFNHKKLRGSCKWARRHHASTNGDDQFFSIHQCIALITFLVNNSFLATNNTLKRQKLGIPMGTNCAPLLANLYLYWYEADFMDKLIRTQNVEKARRFHSSFRLIDDLLSNDNEYWDDFLLPYELGGFYPQALCPLETSGANHVNFLGMRISLDDTGNFVISVYDKRKDFPFKVRNYPFLESNIPVSLCYNVFYGQLYRYHRICTSTLTFITTSVDLAIILATRGYSTTRLKHLFRRFVGSHHDFNASTTNMTATFHRALLTALNSV